MFNRISFKFEGFKTKQAQVESAKGDCFDPLIVISCSVGRLGASGTQQCEKKHKQTSEN